MREKERVWRDSERDVGGEGERREREATHRPWVRRRRPE